MKSIFIFFLLINLTIYAQESASTASQLTGKSYTGNHKTKSTSIRINAVNIYGNLNELVIPVGFPDKPNTIQYPYLSNNPLYPVVGQFPGGTLLSDFIKTHGGRIAENLWFEPAFNHYFTTESGGLYKVNFHFIKKADGTRYLTKHDFGYFEKLNKHDFNVVIGQWRKIVSEVADNMYAENHHVFDNIDLLHFTFEGLTKREFWNGINGGTVMFNVNLTSPDGKIIYKDKPVSIQIKTSAIPHEYMHLIGALAGYPPTGNPGTGFSGFPDRGIEKQLTIDGHNNMLWTYDMMYHNASLLPLHSLYGLPPILSHDLIFLGWIKPDEIKVIDENNYLDFSDIKLADVNYPLTPLQINDGYCRIAKVMIHKNYSDGLSEYFLIEYHAASEFDKAFENYAEFPVSGYNTGVLIWHIKEKTNLIDIRRDDMIELEAAVPYNGWYGSAVPNDSYPRNYKRPKGWNGIYNGDNNYLDDDRRDSNGRYYYLPEGGEHIWEKTVKYDSGNTFGWDPTGTRKFMRLQSMSSDFFGNTTVKGHLTEKMTDATRPSTMDWGGYYGPEQFNDPVKTHIAITNITRRKGYMTVKVFYNYWTGEISKNSVMSGNVMIAGNLIIDEGVTLTVKPGTVINYCKGSSIKVKGRLVLPDPPDGQVKFKSCTEKSAPGN